MGSLTRYFQKVRHGTSEGGLVTGAILGRRDYDLINAMHVDGLVFVPTSSCGAHPG